MRRSLAAFWSTLITGFAVSMSSSAAQIAQVAEQVNSCGKRMTAEMKAQKALDILEIQNMASMHEYYHSALMHQAELDNVWSTRDDIAWKNNSDYYANRKDVYKFYAEGVKKMDPRGALWYHMLATPVVVVAGDGRTAKAVWQSFGNVSGPNMAQWTQEKYAMDMIKENGAWKIWHLRTYVEFYSDVDAPKVWAGANLAAPPGSKNAVQMGPPPGSPPADGNAKPSVTIKEEAGGGIKFDEELARPTENGNYYEGYSESYLPKFKPVPPSPYCTWKDTKGYNVEE